MKVVILAGGYGTRLSEETHALPKPMVEIGDMPILWHIMKYYSTFGFKEFVICLGYIGNVIKDYFCNYWLHSSDITLKISPDGNEIKVRKNVSDDWEISLVDTGVDVQTGLRIKRIQSYIGNERFMLTYGDGISDVDLNALLAQHSQSGKIVTITGIKPHGRFGVIDFDDTNTITSFSEKGKAKYINAGFMVVEPKLFDYLGENEPLEYRPFETVVSEGSLGVYLHNGFWRCVDTLSDLKAINSVWESPNPPWKIWS
jgi:glucose-1-phosphate cytidylyltransferase